MDSNGDVWTNGTDGTNGVLRNGSERAGTLGRRRTKSGPKRVTFKLESDSPPRDGTSGAETETADGMPSWWPRASTTPTQTVETTAQTMGNSPFTTSRPPPAVIISPPAVTPSSRNDLELAPRVLMGSGAPVAGVWHPNGNGNGSVHVREASPPSPVGNGHRDTALPPPPITMQSRGPTPMGSQYRGGVSVAPPIAGQDRAPVLVENRERDGASVTPPSSTWSREPMPVGSRDRDYSSFSPPSTVGVASSPSSQTSRSGPTPVPSWWPRPATAECRPASAGGQGASEAHPTGQVRRPPPEPEYYDNTSPQWQARNSAPTQPAASQVPDPAASGSTVATDAPSMQRSWKRALPAPPVETRPVPQPPIYHPPSDSEHQLVARVVTQANQSFLQSAKDVTSVAPPLPARPPEPDSTHPSEEDFWHLSPRPSRRQPLKSDSDVIADVRSDFRGDVPRHQLASELTQTGTDATWSRLLGVVTDVGTEVDARESPRLQGPYRDTLRRRTEPDTASLPPPAPQRQQHHQQEVHLQQLVRAQQGDQRTREHQQLLQQQEEERQRREQEEMLRQQEGERRRREQQHILEQQDEERRRREQKQFLQHQEEERRRQEQPPILQPQEEQRRRHEQQKILQQQEEEQRRYEQHQMLQRREEEQRRQERQELLQKQEEDRRRREHEELLRKQEEERKREQNRLLQQQEQRQFELQEQLQRELQMQHQQPFRELQQQQQQWRLAQEEQEEQRQRDLQQQQQQLRQEREQASQQQQRLASDWRRVEDVPPTADGLRRNVSLREAGRPTDLARRAGRVWDEDGDWGQQSYVQSGAPSPPGPGPNSSQAPMQGRRVSEIQTVSTTRWDGANGRDRGIPLQTSVRREVSGKRSESSERAVLEPHADPQQARRSPAPNSGGNFRTPDYRGGQRRASFQQSFQSPTPGGYVSPASPSKSDPGWTFGSEEKDSGRSSPSPLDDELEICLKSVEEAMASLQDTVKKNDTRREAGPATLRQSLNRSFDVPPTGGSGSGDWRRRSCDGMELESFGRSSMWQKQRLDDDELSADGMPIGKDARSLGVLRPLQHNACHLWTAGQNSSSNWTRLVIGDWLLGSQDNRTDVLARQIALWEGQPAGQGQGQRSICGPQDRGYGPRRGVGQMHEQGLSEDERDEVGSEISRIGLESRQKHRHITERMLPSAASPGAHGTSLQRHDSWRASSQTPTPSSWQQSASPPWSPWQPASSPPQSAPDSWQSDPVRQSPESQSGDWNGRQTPRQSPSEQPQLPWEQNMPRALPQELPWSTGVVSQARRANTLAETRGGSGFGRRPTLSSYPSQSATLPAGQPRSPAAWGLAEPRAERGRVQSPASAQASPGGPQMAAPGGHWAAPLSPSGSVASVDWNQLFETSSERSSCVDDELSSVSGDWQRPLSRAEVVRWYQQHQLPRGVGVDALTGRAAAWFHGIVGRSEAEQRLLPCPPGAYLVRCSLRIWGYTLSYRSQKRCKHFLVEAADDGYRFYGNPDRLFRTLDELLRFHTMQPITKQGAELLRFPCTNHTNTAASQLVI